MVAPAPKSTNASIQAFFPPTPTASSSPTKTSSSSPIGDGFTTEEVEEALKPPPVKEWQPPGDYTEVDIRDLYPGPQAVTFMGRVANIYDVVNSPKTPRSATGCVKLTVKDDDGAITVRMWYATRYPHVRLGSLVSVWCSHISNGESANLSSMAAPLFASLFPERDRSCHLMVHEHSDDGTTFKRPLDHREGRPLSGLMTLQSFTDGGYDVVDAKILVVVKSIGQRRKIERKDGSTTENMNIQVHDDTAEATLGLWGTLCLSPSGGSIANDSVQPEDAQPQRSRAAWEPGKTVLLLQAPGWKISRTTYLNFTSTTIVDIDPGMKDADWLRRWAIRQKSREAINPSFPEGIFDLDVLTTGPLRCLYTIAELDQFARAAPKETFQGYLSVLIMEVKLLELKKRNMLMCGECCAMPSFANAHTAKCRGCEKDVMLRPNPKIVLDETASISSGKLLFSDKAWKELLGRSSEELLRLGHEETKELADRLLFCRVTLLFGWTGNEAIAGGRICVMGVMAG